MNSFVNSAKVGAAVTGALAATWAVSSMPAAAADLRPVIVQPPKVVPAFDPWNAFSVGFGAVGTVFLTPTQASVSGYGASLGTDLTVASQGLGGTIEVGKDFHVAPNFVFGIYGDLRLGNQKGSYSASSNGYDDLDLDGSVSFGNSATVLARAGFLVNPKTLVYGLIGYTWQQYKAQVHGFSDYYGDADASKSGTLGGLTAGIGGETMLNDWLSLKGEYRFTHLGSIGGFGTGDQPYTGQGSDATDMHQIRLVLSAKWH